MIGASLLSGAASLPLHLMPLIVAILSTQGQLTIGQAGWIGSAYMLGQLVGTIALPALRFSRLTTRQAIVAAITILAGLSWSLWLTGPKLVLPWLLVGSACGALQFLGATAAAAAKDRTAAFATRLGVALLISGVAIGVLQASNGLVSYPAMVIALSAFFCLLTTIGLGLYRQPDVAVARGDAAPAGPKTWSGLAFMFLLFMGQIGFWAYAIQRLGQSGVVFSESAYAIALCKGLAGIFLLVRARRKGDGNLDVLLPGLCVSAAVVVMTLADGALIFVVGLLAWELGFNFLSARLQALVTRENPAHVGKWLTAAVFLGAASGPILHGAALSWGAGAIFILYACLSALLPWVWVNVRKRAGAAGTEARPT